MLLLEKKFLAKLESKSYQDIYHLDWFVAISGGVDSICLLNLIHSSFPEKKLTAIHLNHQISSKAKNWQKHCKQTCKKLKVSFISKKLSISNHSQPKNKKFKSFEAEAREKRIKTFLKMIPEQACLFLAHHQDDQIETYLFRLVRGSNNKGLACIKEHSFIKNSKVHLKRPMIDLCNKNDLYTYAKKKKIKWFEDESNTDSRIKRNFIRHHIIPSLEKVHPGANKSILRQVQFHKDNSDLYQEFANQDINQCLTSKQIASYLNVNQLRQLTDIRIKNLIVYFAEKYWNYFFGSSKELDLLIHQFIRNGKHLSEFNLVNLTLKNYHNLIIAFKKKQNQTELIQLPKLKKKPLNRFPLKLRQGFLEVKSVEESDWGINVNDLQSLQIYQNQPPKEIMLASRKHHQSLKKLFQEYNIPCFLRKDYPFIALEKKIIFLPNIGLCKGYRTKKQLDTNKAEVVKLVWNYL